MTAAIQVTRKDHLAVVTLNRPEKMNSLTITIGFGWRRYFASFRLTTTCVALSCLAREAVLFLRVPILRNSRHGDRMPSKRPSMAWPLRQPWMRWLNADI